MKKSYLLGLGAIALLLASCNDMLDVKPRDRFENEAAQWNNENVVSNYLNSMYGNFSGYGYSGTGGDFYFSSLSDDQANPNFDNWTFTSVPGSSSYWSTPYAEIRRCNELLDHMATSTIAEGSKKKFCAIARLMRAYNYFLLVQRYGDVQWVEHAVSDTEDESIYDGREDRDIIMDKVLKDLDIAIADIGGGSKETWSKDLALAIKSDICLYEGTYCKYRVAEDNAGKGPDNNRAKKYLEECVKASEELMPKYSLTTNYGEIYNSLNLSGSTEVIFYRNYEKDLLGHSTVDYTSGSTAQRGLTKDAIDAFLFLDGKPLATTSLNKSDAPERVPYYFYGLDGSKGDVLKDGDGEDRYVYSMEKPFSVRDKRLRVIADTYLAVKSLGHARTWLAEMTASTGYTIGKYYTPGMGATASEQQYYCNNIGTGYTDAPIYYLSKILLNYAEAKAELGTISQEDLDNSVNKLQARAGLPGMTLTPANDPANNHGVSDLLWEIRRVRRCELMTDGNRYWDLVRWHQLDKLDSEKYPQINRGAYLKDAQVYVTALETKKGVEEKDMTKYDLDEAGYIIPVKKTRTFNKKYYFYPIPSEMLNTNPNFTQNPGW